MPYPVGLLKLWLQLDDEHIHDLATAWYATSLVPKTVAAGQAVAFLFLVVTSNAAALLCAAALITLIFSFVPTVHTSRLGPKFQRGLSDPVDYRGKVRGARIVVLEESHWISLCLALTTLFLLLCGGLLVGKVAVDSYTEAKYYVGFLALAVLLGALGGSAIIFGPHARISLLQEFPDRQTLNGPERSIRKHWREHRDELRDRFEDRYKRSVRLWRRVGLTVAIVGAVLSTLCLARVTDLSLPSAQLGSGEAITLLSISEGRVNGFNCKGAFVSTPSETAGRVTITTEPHGLHVYCRVLTPTTSGAPLPP
jgi:hypothetical protein